MKARALSLTGMWPTRHMKEVRGLDEQPIDVSCIFNQWTCNMNAGMAQNSRPAEADCSWEWVQGAGSSPAASHSQPGHRFVAGAPWWAGRQAVVARWLSELEEHSCHRRLELHLRWDVRQVNTRLAIGGSCYQDYSFHVRRELRALRQ